MNFADGQRRTCRLQIFCLPSANETSANFLFAIGKRFVSSLQFFHLSGDKSAQRFSLRELVRFITHRARVHVAAGVHNAEAVPVQV